MRRHRALGKKCYNSIGRNDLVNKVHAMCDTNYMIGCHSCRIRGSHSESIMRRCGVPVATSASQHRFGGHCSDMKDRLAGKKVHHAVSLKERYVTYVLIWTLSNLISSPAPRSVRRTREHQNKHLFIKRYSKRRRPIMKEDQIKPRS